MQNEFRLVNEFKQNRYRSNEINNIINTIRGMVVRENSGDFSAIEAGQTYIGQFIAHDIVPSGRFNINRKNISPSLNLKSLYGDKYDSACFNKKGKFKTGKAEGSSERNTDLKRKSNGKPKIPELRNDENIILSQFHLLLQILHNAILDHVVELNIVPKDEAFIFTKHCLISLFHQLVIEDFLFQIINKDVYKHYYCDGEIVQNHFYKNDDFESLPIEFTNATLRFGHSMVRSNYKLNTDSSVETLEIFRHRFKKLPKRFIVDWRFFFQTDKFENNYFSCAQNSDKDSIDQPRIRSAMRIDTNVVSPMTALPNRGCKIDIRKVNLKKNFLIPMASGLETFKYVRNFSELSDFLTEVDLAKYKFDFELPLWVFILIESEQTNQNPDGCRNLGPLASIINCEVLNQSILMAKNDIANKYKEDIDQFIKKHIFQDEFTRFGRVINYLTSRGEIIYD